MLLQKLKNFISANKYLFLIFVTVLIFFYPIFRNQIPFPGDLLVHYYEPYSAYPIMNYSPGAVPSKGQGPDVVRHIFPWKTFSIDSLKNGQIPFWDPHNFSGNPLMANFQSAVFYPLNLIFFVLPLLPAWTIFIMSAPLLGALFMFLFLREIRLGKLASFFGGIVFAFSSYMVVWMEYGNIDNTVIWFPLGLFLTEKIVKNRKIKYNLLLVFVLLISLLAGYIQAFFYVCGTLFIYFLIRSFESHRFSLKDLIVFLVTLFFPLLLSLFQIIPTKELFDISTRSNYSLSQIQNLLNPWWYSITVVVPNFFGNPAAQNHWFYGTYIERVSYIGIIPFVLAIYAFANFKRNIFSLIFGILAIIAFVLSLDLLITKYFFLLPIPVISTAVPTRILSIFQFSSAILAAIGLNDLIRRKNKSYLFLSTIIVGIILLSAWLFALIGYKFFAINAIDIAVSRKNLILPSVLFFSFIIFCFAYFVKKFKLTLVLVVVVTLADLFYFFNKITPFSPKEFVYPQTPVISYLKTNAQINRFWGYGSGYIESNFQTYDGTFSPDGVDPLHITRYARLLESAKTGRIAEELPRPDANVPPGYGQDDLKNNKYRQRLLDLLGIKYVLNKTQSKNSDYITFPQNIYKLLYADGYYQVYENKEVLPRFFLASNYIVETDKQKIIDKIFDQKFDLSKTIILEEKPVMKFGEDKNASVNLQNYRNNNVSFSISSKTNQILFLSDTDSPTWRARIDGKDVKLLRADYAFRAVSVPAGNHKVEFYYGAEGFYGSLKLSFLSLIFLILLYIGFKKYEKK